MEDDQQFCLRWNNHQSTLVSVIDNLLESEKLVDCTLAAEGQLLKAHKVVLSACSPYFATVMEQNYEKHPVVILKDVKFRELKAMMDYMYRGEVNISQDELAALLRVAESLQIKGLSDSRCGAMASKPDHPRVTLPTGKLSAGYTLEQTKRARTAGPPEPDMGSREGSSSPSRRRRKVRRRSNENAMTDVHDNSNSSQQLHQTQSNASGLGAITAAASALAAAAAAASNQQSLVSNISVSAPTSSSTAVTATTGSTLSSSKKTDNAKGTTQQQTQHDAMNTENAQGPASAITATGSIDAETIDAAAAAAAAAATVATDKPNHKQHMQQQHKQQAKDSINASGAASSSELVIEPKAEYDDEANDEPVEDLTLDEEDMGMDDLDQNAGTSQGGEGSSQGYAPWQHDRSQDELLMATQEAQQRDPQDIYPILGSLLGVDTNNSIAASPSNSHNDLLQTYGFLNNNNTTLTTAAKNNNKANNDNLGTISAATNAASGTSHSTQSLLINALAGRGAILERDDYMQCKHCKRFYKSMQKLQEHVKKYCLKEKKYKCISCEYRSRRKDHVLRHAKRKHCELYEQYRDDDENLYVIRTEEEGSFEADADTEWPNDDYLIPAVSMGIGSGSVCVGGGDTDEGNANVASNDRASSVAASTMQSMGLKFGSRDLIITAVPVLQESEEDDDDYDEDGE